MVALLIVADIATSGYLANYAIGCAGDGGDRNIEEVAIVESEGTEGRIEANRTEQALLTAAFLEQVSPSQVEIVAGDGVRLAGFAYEQADSADTPSPTDSPASSANAATPENNAWALVVHGYRDSNESAYVLDMA